MEFGKMERGKILRMSLEKSWEDEFGKKLGG
jgi:hypothetical protein